MMALVAKNPPVNVSDTRDGGLFPGLGRAPEVGNGNPLQYPSLENSMDGNARQSSAHGDAKSQT